MQYSLYYFIWLFVLYSTKAQQSVYYTILCSTVYTIFYGCLCYIALHSNGLCCLVHVLCDVCACAVCALCCVCCTHAHTHAHTHTHTHPTSDMHTLNDTDYHSTESQSITHTRTHTHTHTHMHTHMHTHTHTHMHTHYPTPHTHTHTHTHTHYVHRHRFLGSSVTQVTAVPSSHLYLCAHDILTPHHPLSILSSLSNVSDRMG